MTTAMTYKYFNIPFALSGDQTAIPDPVQGSGVQSWTEGRNYTYALNPATDPAAHILDRQQDNYLYFSITKALQNLEQHYVPEFIDSAANGGSPFSYSKKDRVRLPSTNETYESLIDSNTTTPPSASWVVVPQTGTTYLPVAATVGGTGNAITATFVPVINNPSIDLAIWVRSVAANSGATTFNPDGSGAVAVYKGNNQPLVGGEIAGAGQWLLLIKDTTLSKWMLANPYLTAASVPDATTIVKGIGYLATNVEAQTGTDTSKFITPASLASVTATTTRAGLTETATNAEVQAQTDTSRYITPSGLGACTATTTRAGISPLATQAEVNAGIDSSKIVTSATLSGKLIKNSIAGQTYTTNNIKLTFAHGLTGFPTLINVYLKCLSSDIGYSVNDRVQAVDASDSPGNNEGYQISYDATNVYVIISNGINLLNKSTSAYVLISNASKWQFNVDVVQIN